MGAYFLSGMIFIACMVTAIGLTCACAEYFSSLTKIPYKIFVFILVGFSLIISNLGLTKLIAVSVPVLSAIYPPAISVILLSFCASFFKKPSHVIAPVTLVALPAATVAARSRPRGVGASRSSCAAPRRPARVARGSGRDR